MSSLTACIITFNEEARIRRCLESVAFCDEVLVVDSHSTDRTREIAEELGARVIERDWPGHIDQKNFAIEQATHPWVLCLDADECVTPELQALIVQALQSPDHDGYEVRRRNLYLGRWLRHGGWYPSRKLRLFRRDLGRWKGTNPHDHLYLDPPGRVGRLEADLEHESYASLSDHMTTIDYFASVAAEEKLAKGQHFVTLNLVLNPPLRFLKTYLLQLGFLDGWRGFVAAWMGAFYVFLRYAKLWHLVHVEGLARGTGERVEYGRRGEHR